MKAIKSLVPILTNLQLGKNKELVSPVELLQAVKVIFFSDSSIPYYNSLLH